jgi:hypothetical protein
MPQWKKVEGNELEDGLIDKLGDLLPDGPAIYMWRRNLRPPVAVLSSAVAFREWVDTIMSVPLGLVKRRELSHYCVLGSLLLGGQALSEAKGQTIDGLAMNPKGRAYLAEFLSSLASALPSLYVGEATNLRTRVLDHIRGDSGLKEVLATDFGVSWHDLDLWFYPLPKGSEDATKALRTLLETLATQLTLAPSVKRIG